VAQVGLTNGGSRARPLEDGSENASLATGCSARFAVTRIAPGDTPQRRPMSISGTAFTAFAARAGERSLAANACDAAQRRRPC